VKVAAAYAPQGSVHRQARGDMQGERSGNGEGTSEKQGPLQVRKLVPLYGVTLGQGLRKVPSLLEVTKLRLEDEGVGQGHEEIPPGLKRKSGIRIDPRGAARERRSAVAQKSEGGAGPNANSDRLGLGAGPPAHRDEEAR